MELDSYLRADKYGICISDICGRDNVIHSTKYSETAKIKNLLIYLFWTELLISTILDMDSVTSIVHTPTISETIAVSRSWYMRFLRLG